MSDFLLDFRDTATRQQAVMAAGSALKFCDDSQFQIFDRESFSLVITRADSLDLWGPYEWQSEHGKGMVALVGRIALDERKWDLARKVEGPGGLACKAIFNLYREGGVNALGDLNGNFVVLVHDEQAHKFYFVTDRCGMCLAYGKKGADRPLVYGSHPDVVASALGEAQAWDMTSLAEFLMFSRLTFPYTYYRNVHGLEPGHIHTFGLQNGTATHESSKRYFHLEFDVDSKATEWDLAEELSSGFKSAVKKRTLPFLRTSGVGLSGGLDSRALLAAAGAGEHIRAFTLFDEENAEFKVARAIAEACDVQMIPIKREFDYYGNSAELGVRISGGMGPISCNHLLGARQRLKDFGIQNILTGCYCDYLLKGLALNTVESKFSRIQKLGKFGLECYEPGYWFDSPYRDEVVTRMTTLFPEPIGSSLSDGDWLKVERKRSFPLAYETDLAQRVIPQRVMPWYVPIVDNDIVGTYLKIPSRYKLNASLFKKMLRLLCPEKLGRIPDNNTGAPVNASWPRQALHTYCSSFQNRIDRKVRGRMATRGSWPNMLHYFRHSKLVESLWARPSAVARDTLSAILGKNPFEKSIGEHAAENLGLSFNLLTQKLWLDQRL